MAANTIQILISAKDTASDEFSKLGDSISGMADKSGAAVTKSSDTASTSLSGLSGRSAIVFGAIIGGAQAVVNKGINMITSAVGDAINRVDTLNNANRTFSNMGFTAGDTKKAMDNLKTSILGLPTSLSDAVGNVEILSAATQDVGKGQKVFSAMNDAILGFGGSSDMVKNATIQLSQAFSNGKVDGMTWISMMNSGMGPVLNAMAKQMGITTGALKDGLASGDISVQQFQDSLTTLDSQGGGGIKSLHQIAKDSTSGIGTGFANMKTSITRGLADIIQAIGAANISNAVATIGSTMEKALKAAATGFTETVKWIKENQAWIKPLAVVVGAMATAWFVWTAAVKAWELATKIATGVQAAFNAVMDANPVMLVVIAIAGLVAAFIYFWNTSAGFRDFFKGIWKDIQAAFKAVVDFIKEHWQLMLAILLGPLGIAVGLIIKYWKNIQAAAEAVWKAIKDTASAVWNWLWSNLIKPIVDFIIGYFTVMFNIYKYIFEWMRALAELAWNYIWANVIKPVIDLIVAGIKWLSGIVVGVWNWIAAVASAAWNWLWQNVISPVVNAIVAAANWLGGVFAGIWNWIAAVATGAWNWISSVASGVWRGIVGVWNGVYGFFSGIASHISSAIGGAFSSVGDTASGIWGGIKNAFTGGINWIIDHINSMIDKVNSVADKVPGAPHLGHIGRLATGTQYADAGTYLVGEQGPELVNLPKGAQVTPAWKTRQQQDQNSGGGSNVFQLNINHTGNGQFTYNDAVDMSKQIVRALKTQGLDLTEMAQLR